jgi:RNA polymerase sigma factor (sigma-70 family)
MTPEELFLANEKLVYQALKKYYPKIYFDEDLQQIARIGLWKACQTYNQDLSMFSTYAMHCIYNELIMHFRYNGNPRRSNPNGAPISLSEPVGKDGEETSIEEIITGTTDIGYVDFDGFWKSLTEEEKHIVVKKMNGKPQKQIGKELGMVQSTIHNKLIRIREKFDEYI